MNIKIDTFGAIASMRATNVTGTEILMVDEIQLDTEPIVKHPPKPDDFTLAALRSVAMDQDYESTDMESEDVLSTDGPPAYAKLIYLPLPVSEKGLFEHYKKFMMVLMDQFEDQFGIHYMVPLYNEEMERIESHAYINPTSVIESNKESKTKTSEPSTSQKDQEKEVITPSPKPIEIDTPNGKSKPPEVQSPIIVTGRIKVPGIGSTKAIILKIDGKHSKIDQSKFTVVQIATRILHDFKKLGTVKYTHDKSHYVD